MTGYSTDQTPIGSACPAFSAGEKQERHVGPRGWRAARRVIAVAAFATMLGLGANSALAEQNGDEDGLSLITDTPQEGFAVAVQLAQKGVATTQPDAEVRQSLRDVYERDADSLMKASEVIAIHFRTVAEANNYWRE
ncbi:hexameric tyrosine-coordinated heme protein [Aquisalimonas lutea]|uniref:hexameric tyrosine-coordinated heme protein n=1 Tax=Aquisalimonas lutea TaxID=1327750 RepID=UPI0025B55457|nr:hexameric tyrosine-coordinated heme protein [Aquisalimonas lutea]MDN3519771.1 hexameric tyrosine-coordinated heme protein [Aquisalimonas lutea]